MLLAFLAPHVLVLVEHRLGPALQSDHRMLDVEDLVDDDLYGVHCAFQQ
jgi:hypothetical protein